jgi:hypothetical protein
MRFFRAALVSMLLLLTSAAAAPLVPVLTVRMDPVYLSDQGSFSAVAGLSGATSSVGGRLYFRRYDDPACNGPYTSVGSVNVSGNRDYTGPNLQSGQFGDFGLMVYFDSSNSTTNTDQTSSCVKYVRQQRTSVDVVLPKSRYDSPARLEPQGSLAGAPEGTPIEFERFSTADCTGKVVSGLTDDGLGAHSIRAVYRGSDTLAASSSACRSYNVVTYIRGRVFVDIDNNGTFDEGESGIANVTVTLRRGQSTAGNAATTTADGQYQFTVEAAGDYTIVQTQPAGYDSTTPNELAVTVAGPALADKHFGEAATEASPLRLAGSTAPRTSPPLSESDSGGGFAVVQTLAIALVIMAVVVLIGLLYLARSRRGDGGA